MGRRMRRDLQGVIRSNLERGDRQGKAPRAARAEPPLALVFQA
jgi:hypothetical protein